MPSNNFKQNYIYNTEGNEIYIDNRIERVEKYSNFRFPEEKDTILRHAKIVLVKN